MAEPEVEKPAPDPMADMKTALEAANKASVEATARADAAEKAAQAAQAQVTAIAGQAFAAPRQPIPEEAAPDFSMEPEKALEWHLNRRTAPLIAEQQRRESLRERQLAEMKSPDDWAKYGKGVEELITKQRISADVLSQPGSFGELLQFVKSKDVDKLVEERVSVERAKWTAETAKTAGSAPSTSGVSNQAGKNSQVDATDEEIRIWTKLGVDPKKAADIAKSTTYDGVRIHGDLVH